MGQQTKTLGAATHTAYSEQGTGYIYASKFVASTFYTGHPVTGAIGNSSKPILVTGLSISGLTGNNSVRFQAGDSTPNGFSGAEAVTADETCYYGFRKSDGGFINFKRGDGANPNGIYGNGTSLNPSVDPGVATWPSTSINASITWQHVPSAPSSFTSTGVTNSSISLSWGVVGDNGGDDVDNYRVLYKVRNTSTDGDPASWSVKVINSTTRSTTITGLTANTTYDFRVAAMNDVTDAHSGGTYTTADAITGANASLNSVTTDNVAITGFSMPYGIINKPYSGHISTTGTVTFGITSGSLPPGLSLGSSSGAVTGTPTTAGTYNFTIGVYSGGVLALSQAFTVVVYPSGPWVITNASATPITKSRSTVKVYDGTWKNGFMRVYDVSYTAEDGTHWRPIN